MSAGGWGEGADLLKLLVGISGVMELKKHKARMGCVHGFGIENYSKYCSLIKGIEEDGEVGVNC